MHGSRLRVRVQDAYTVNLRPTVVNIQGDAVTAEVVKASYVEIGYVRSGEATFKRA
jgi:phosphoribosylformylglycinamidine (FGAM) synthase PurS component